MAVRGSALYKNHDNTLYNTELSPHNPIRNGCLWLAISWKVLKGLKLNLVQT